MGLGSIDAFMAVGAHHDDVDLRVGGTFARLVREGKSGCYVVAVDNAYVNAQYTNAQDSHEALATRRREATRASQILGAGRLEWLEFKSFFFSTPELHSQIYPSFDSLQAAQHELRNAILQGLPPVANADRFPQCRSRFAELIEEFAPQVIFTHSPDDRHPDHYALSRFVELMVRELNEGGREIELLFWEPGSAGPIAGFAPNFFVELSKEDVRKKQKALDGYVSQFPKGKIDTFAEDRAGTYGGMAGVTYAEPFRKGSCEPPGQDAWRPRLGFFDEIKRGAAPREVYRL